MVVDIVIVDILIVDIVIVDILGVDIVIYIVDYNRGQTYAGRSLQKKSDMKGWLGV